MKYLFALGLVAALCLLGVSCNEESPEKPAAEAATEDAAVKNKEKVCEPGAVSQVRCNTCICSTDGLELACTKKTCVEGLEEGEAKPEGEGEVKAENLPVPDGEQVKAENLPVPEADLKKAEAEIPAVAKDRRRRRRDDEDACEPGKTFKKECNDCECPASGKKSEAHICTLIAC